MHSFHLDLNRFYHCAVKVFWAFMKDIKHIQIIESPHLTRFSEVFTPLHLFKKICIHITTSTFLRDIMQLVTKCYKFLKNIF